MKRLMRVENILAPLSVLLPLPWWWVVPGVLGLLAAGSAGVALAPALRALTWPFLGLTILSLGRGWYLDRQHRDWRSGWRQRGRLVLWASTVLSILLWGLRFGGLLGARPWP